LCKIAAVDKAAIESEIKVHEGRFLTGAICLIAGVALGVSAPQLFPSLGSKASAIGIVALYGFVRLLLSLFKLRDLKAQLKTTS
jgi:hypothetical protein